MSNSTDSSSASSGDQTAHLSRQEVDQLLNDQRQRSERGQSFLVETYLDHQPGLKSNNEAILDLIYNEMMLREAHGDKPTLAEYLQRFPQLAQELADQFEIEQVLQDESDTEHSQTQKTPGPKYDAPLPARGMPDFELLEILGRGAKGVVYKATQKSLHRTVALKMIRAGDQASQEDLARFRLEAEAIARLQHPNLVQIYEVGEWDGQAYLALEYVDGGNLADRMKGPWPALEAVRLIETLAGAMHHAHLKGIVHRDLKPANILLVASIAQQTAGRESANPHSPLTAHHPKITDFGLAKFVIGDTTGLTETGSFLGTPAYTAPEQAMGRTNDIGPAADVYALGAIFYELLTGQPPFDGTSVFHVLEQVRSAEPVAPTRLVPALPRDLETICLKCLEKDSRRRYASAQVLADDLQRFQNGQPILARPVGRIERVGKWVKRRPAAAGLIGVLALSVIAFSLAGWWSAYKQANLRKEADKNFMQAEKNFSQAMEAVDYFLDEVGAVDLENVPLISDVRKNLLLKAKGFYDTFLAERGNDPKIRLQAGRGFNRLGTIHELLDEHGAAEKAYRRASELLNAADASHEQRRELARTWNQLGGLLKKLGRTAEAEEAARKGLAICKEMAENSADDAGCQQDLAMCHHDLGTILVRLPKERDAAHRAYEEALRLQEKLIAKANLPIYQRDRARTLNNYGLSLQYTTPAVAVGKLRDAVAINQALVAKYPDVPAYRRELARTCNNLAGVLGAVGKREAEKTYDEALAHFEKLARDFPTVPTYRQDLAGVHSNVGLFHENQGLDYEERKLTNEAEEAYLKAVKAYEDSIAVRRQLAGESPEVPDYQQRLANNLVTLASLLERRNQASAAEQQYREAAAMLEKIAVPGARPVYFSDLAQVLNHRAAFLARRCRIQEIASRSGICANSIRGTPWPSVISIMVPQSDMAESLTLTMRAVRFQRSALDADSKNLVHRQQLLRCYLNLAIVAIECGKHEIAADAAREVLQLSPKRKGDFVLAAETLARCIPLACADPRLMDRYADQSVGYLREAIAFGFGDAPNEVLYLELRWEYDPLRHRPDFRKLFDNVKSNPPRNT